MEVKYLKEDNLSEIIKVLSEAFYNYPVMRYVLRDKYYYKERLYKLIDFFISARIYRNEPMLGIYNIDGLLTAAAVVTLPDKIPTPEKLIEHRKELWEELGKEEQKRYEVYGKAAGSLMPSEPHHHLNMIGVRSSFQGRGLARKLINAVEELTLSHPESTGLSLNTEDESNVKLYLHLGYKVIGNVKVDNNFETWGFFKAK
jgi:ribosomal protein S18 acetylase RimI-like enzyme